jgi:tetratricopeptide (TPR) repeat protein
MSISFFISLTFLAIKCFTYSGDEFERIRAEAYELTKKGMDASEEEEKNRLLIEAGELFASISKTAHAGRCFWRAGAYLRAAEQYESIFAWAESARCYAHVERWVEAAPLYERAAMLAEAFDCFAKADDPVVCGVHGVVCSYSCVAWLVL